MATPTRITLINTRRLWVSTSILVFLLLSIVLMHLMESARSENKKNINLKTDILIRSHSSQLYQKDYRTFVENLGNDFKEMYIEVRDANSTFTSGIKKNSHYCTERHFPNVSEPAPPEMVLQIKVCSPELDFRPQIAQMFVLLLLLITTTHYFLVLVERRAIQGMKALIKGTSIEINDSEGLQEVLSKIQAIKTSLDEAHNEKIMNAKDIATAHVASQIAHDIRAPLGLLKTICSSECDITEAERREAIKNALERIETIANGLLSIYRKNGNHTEKQMSFTMARLSKEPLSPILEEVIKEFRLLNFSPRQINFRLISDTESKSSRVLINKNIFFRIIANLLINSIESIVAGGEIELSLTTASSISTLEIRDNGRGIPQNVLPGLFSRGATYDKANGTGFGLWHAKKYIEEWHGSISLISSEGTGTTLIISLPIAF